MCTGLPATEFPHGTLPTMSLPETLTGVLPPTFAHGYASSATQMESGWTEDGKGSSVWDRDSKDGQIFDGSSCAVANDSYHLAKKDVELLKVLGAKAYRFSIAWRGSYRKVTMSGGDRVKSTDVLTPSQVAATVPSTRPV
jgi:hypothetical protein